MKWYLNDILFIIIFALFYNNQFLYLFLQLLGHLLMVAKQVADKKGLDNGYRMGEKSYQ